jgi:hypothetical protein
MLDREQAPFFFDVCAGFTGFEDESPTIPPICPIYNSDILSLSLSLSLSLFLCLRSFSFRRFQGIFFDIEYPVYGAVPGRRGVLGERARGGRCIISRMSRASAPSASPFPATGNRQEDTIRLNPPSPRNPPSRSPGEPFSV